jgi:hypothetical protein
MFAHGVLHPSSSSDSCVAAAAAGLLLCSAAHRQRQAAGFWQLLLSGVLQDKCVSLRGCWCAGDICGPGDGAQDKVGEQGLCGAVC